TKIRLSTRINKLHTVSSKKPNCLSKPPTPPNSASTASSRANEDTIMLPRRFSVKYFVSNPEHVELSKFVPIFQRWIQRDLVEGLLIDVAAYEHVHEGPGILLIGDEGDYSLDIRDGRPGLMYTRKRQITGTLPDVLRVSTRLALIAVQKLLAEPS